MGEWEFGWRIALYVFGGSVTFAVGMLGFTIRRLFKTQELLFRKLDKQAKEVHKLQLAVVSTNPQTTSIFRAFMLKDDDEG